MMTKSPKQFHLGVIGLGQMAGVLIIRAIATQTVKPSHIRFLARDQERDRERRRHYRVRPSPDMKTLSRFSDVILLGVKPFQLTDVLRQLAPVYRQQPVWTIAAGPPVAYYRRYLGARAPVIRIMPNMPSVFGLGANGIFFPRGISLRSRDDCLRFLEPAGMVEILPTEKLLSAVLALAGSGPAFFYRYAQSVMQAGVALGLTPRTASRLTRQTLMGSAFALNNAGQSPEKLIAAVASPRGTTFAGLDVLSKNKFTKIIADCMRKVAERGTEIGREIAKG